jgi:hypothetical protein
MTDTASVLNEPTTLIDEPKVKPKKGAGGASKAKHSLLTPIGADEKVSKTVDVIGPDKVKAVYTFKTSERSSDVYRKETVFDFTGCSESDLLFLATATCRITVQRKLRELSEAEMLDPATFAVVNVKADIVDAKRQSADEMTKAIRALKRAVPSLTDEAARKIIEREAGK